MTIYPSLVTIQQHLPRPRIEDVMGTLASQLNNTELLTTLRPGARIAVTAGSRGITNLPLILRSIISELRHAGAEPFIVPAMGSHGGGTADGQVTVLASLGVTEVSVGAPIRSSMATVRLGETAEGIPVYCDRLAFESDGIVVVNRVKVHTAFHGDIESGLSKMLAVGLGKIEGAETMHHHGLGQAIIACARVVRANAPILAGVAVVENAYDEIMDIRVVPPDMFERTDRELLALSRATLPRIPVESFDILIVDEIGKNISGTGMDTNVIGFWRRYGGDRIPDYRILIARSLTEASNGNAMGIGMADLIPRRLRDAIDIDATARNARTSQATLGAIPDVCETDRECIDRALAAFSHTPVRIVRIRNTLDLSTLMVSKDIAETLTSNDDLTIIGNPSPIRFDSSGVLIEPNWGSNKPI